MTTILGLPASLTTPADGDLMVVRDIDDATNKDKKITWANIKAALAYVAQTGAQTIAGVKTFSDGISFGNETLANYDTGTWSPTVQAATLGTLTASYSTQKGRYTRIGDMVFFSFYLALSAYSAGTASGETWVSLPFTASSTNTTLHPFSVISSGIDWPGTPIDLVGEVIPGTNVMRFFAHQDNAVRQYVVPGNLAATDVIASTGFYWV